MIRLHDVTLAPGGVTVVTGVTWHVRDGEKIALVGRNGSGKTTLLRALIGDLDPDHGRIQRRGNLRIGYLPQQAVAGSEETVWDEARSAMTRINELQARLQRAEQAVEEGREGALDEHAEALEAFRMVGGFAIDKRIGGVLHGLGFSPDDWQRPCSSFSGGWQMRIALARLLLSDPDLALLDEPTNHLDLHARSWLAGYLERVPWSVVLVSHDRYVLDRVPERVVEVRGGSIHTYRGNFGTFLQERERRLAVQQAAFEKQQKKIAKLERFVERFGAQANKASQAQDRVKKLERMDRVERPRGLEPLPALHLPEAPPSAIEALILRGATLGWTPDEPVLAGVDIVLERAQKIAVLGPNGGGKTTLLQALAGRLRPSAGRRRVGDRVRIGIFDQDVAAALPSDRSALDYVVGRAPAVPPQQIRTVLGSLGLSGNDALRDIGDLSGGERARVALAALAVRPYNVLLLDEPTNHLDAETVEVLARALEEYEGLLVFVTHDRWLVEDLATHVLRVADGTATLREGVRSEDLEPIPPGDDDEAGDDESSEGALSYEERKRIHRERQRFERRIQAIERELQEIEAAVEALDADLFRVGDDWERAAELGRQRKAHQQRQERLFTEWESLDEQLDALDAQLD